uniref:SNF2_N domain-containing protein n=1 Tax=Heterorhabditis bacteriophora TaxID=37862 RepID=A0A1I7WG92_HETBA
MYIITCSTYIYILTFTNAEKKYNMISLLNVLMQLRKCVSHPYLFKGVQGLLLQSTHKRMSSDVTRGDMRLTPADFVPSSH